jgi:hypothetical protein
MASPFAPEPEEEEEPQYYGSAAQLLPHQAPQQVNIPYLPQDQQPAVPQAVTTPAPPQQAAPPIVFPTAPTPPSMDMTKYEALINKKAGDGPKTVAPKWWERLLGGAVGAGVGYKEGPTAGLRAGGAITGRGQEAENDSAAGRIAGDNAQIEGMQRQMDMSRKGYEDQMSQFKAKNDQANSQQTQQNSDRTFGRESTNDKFTHDRDTSNDTRDQGNKDRTFDYEKQVHGDTLKQQGIENSFEGRRVGVAESKEKRDAADGGSDKLPKGTVTPAEWQNLLKERDKAYNDAQDDRDKELDLAATPAEKSAVHAKYDGKAAQMQNEWNRRLSTADPKGSYAEKHAASAQPVATPQAASPAPAQSPAKPAPAVAPPKGNGKKLTDASIAQQYIKLAGGDKAKARQLAAKDNWQF